MARRNSGSKRPGERINDLSNRRLPRPQERVLLDHLEGRPALKRFTSAGWPDRGMGRSPITARTPDPRPWQRPPTTTPLKAAVSRVYPVVRSLPRPRPVQDRRPLHAVFKQLPAVHRLCVSREDRREVLFATGVAGRGKRKSKGPYRRTPNSKVRCK